jgi:mono/diheme cytochrome c family protein
MRAAAYATFALAAFLLAAHGQNTSYQQDPSWRAPEEAASRRNPLAGKPEAAAGGEKLFKRNCVECHGANGSGLEKKHAADLQLPIVQQQSDGTLFWKITNGNPDRGMPSFSRLPELQRWQLVLYLRTLRSSAEVKLKEKGSNESLK